MSASVAAATDILALGEPMIEFNCTDAGTARQYLQGFGGDSSNFAIAAARQGARVGYVSALGDDRFGAMFRDLWRREGVDAQFVKTDPAGYTALYFVDHDAQGHHFSFRRDGSAASRYGTADLPLPAIASAQVLHCSGISLAISTSACDACHSAIETARGHGVKVSFDTNLRLKLWPLARARAVMTDVMRQTDILLPSLDDLQALTGLVDADAIFDFCLRQGAGLVALKLGAAGALVGDTHRRVRIEPFPCSPVDATGAGDTFGGCFVARLVAGDDWERAARYANVAAALSTEGYGAVEPIPDAQRVAKAIGNFTAQSEQGSGP